MLFVFSLTSLIDINSLQDYNSLVEGNPAPLKKIIMNKIGDIELYTFYTYLDMEECKNRLSYLVKENRYSSGKIQGKVDASNNTFHLFKTSSIEVTRDSYLKMFYGNLIKEEHGTTIKGKFRIHPFGKLLLAFLFGGLPLMSAIMFVSFILMCLSGKTDISSYLWMIWYPPIMCLIGTFLIKFKFCYKSDDKKQILEFIKITLEAEETENSNFTHSNT